MTATYKHPEIDDMITSITGKSRTETVATAKCMTCHGDATEFKDSLSRREYRISGMCQKCQNTVFG